ncbi:phospholipid phosphatase-related protein type 3 isoform X2 [Ahaetulla prasina]|uniref:phospholipid phosphatase-related protein type 3 isoform X2 n=1 Tax=Ahaetulla prasina TaxID=499056 RepID=UPI00264790C0|nr:phospholipid phosphatase-related protein type 3 isoform X2 [Ahaetulla prasina]
MISAKDKAKAPKDSMTLLPCFYFVELPIVASSIVTLYFLELTDLFRPAKVGFQCYDRALSMPYVESNEEMIPLLMLLSLAFAAPAASIMVGEGIVYCLQSKMKGRSNTEGSINAGGCNFNSFLRRTVRFVGVHVFGLCATALVTDVIQLATGYHAPFFLTVCKPNYTLLAISCESNPYITQDICSGQDQHAILSARKTFPSQHATLSAFAAVYVSAYHAVGNFRAPIEKAPSHPPAKDALRALTQRGHDSVYHQNKSVSTDELNPQTRLEGMNRQVPREKNSLGSLKRASVDVDLLAPRSPMGKENMVTFSNTLPRVSTPSMDDPARRHMTIHVPVDASRSKQLITEWKQKSVEGRGMTLAEEVARRVASDSLAGEEEDHIPPSLYPTVQARTAERASMGPRVLIQPRPRATQLVHIPEESQANAGANISPKSSSAVRAKWMMMAEKGAAQRVANPPRLMQVIAMSKQPGMVSVTPKHSETSSSSTSSDSSQYCSPSERDSSSVVTIDAHAPHHPVVHLSSGNGPWEWKATQKASDSQDAYELNEMSKDYHGFRPAKSAGVSPGSSVSDIEQEEARYGSVATINVSVGLGGSASLISAETSPGESLLGASSRESTLRRKPASLTVGEKDGQADETENYYKKMQANRGFKE